jgi:hypothetical protein
MRDLIADIGRGQRAKITDDETPRLSHESKPHEFQEAFKESRFLLVQGGVLCSLVLYLFVY